MEPVMLKDLRERVAPQHTALLIVDMQVDFCVDGAGTAQAGRDLLQSCTITKCSRCRNERLSSFTPTEVCVTCDAGWTPASSRLSCGEFRVACVLIERASAL